MTKIAEVATALRACLYWAVLAIGIALPLLSGAAWTQSKFTCFNMWINFRYFDLHIGEFPQGVVGYVGALPPARTSDWQLYRDNPTRAARTAAMQWSGLASRPHQWSAFGVRVGILNNRAVGLVYLIPYPVLVTGGCFYFLLSLVLIHREPKPGRR
jgi:hypothetical protein